ncbi:nitrate/nitrite transporter [Pallidibacillus thermolactis]|jgi:MFS transporter, NNP family, nitrate/nitrite transporter|uniref:nitrate/nitrite transporter n=1 Tax=Pallidibacillus thermolactis TaxID=251051 RepID=UPI0021DAB10F|nr:nitrate/nitrite transporter [Pallidibacillus thermolactis]MCU9600850.1 MFS transporter [Pallidibacillus thermolactis subsp. kokeshiiformis]
MKKPGIQLSLQTTSLIVGFMVWVLISSLMPYIQKDILLTPGQASIVTAIPVILGSLLRVPIGFYTDRYGARAIFLISFIILLFPIFFISIANSFTDLVIGGLVLGIGGATFSIGVTSLPKYFPKEKHGLVNGIYGVGNIGTAFTTFSAPMFAEAIGWQNTVRLYLILIIVFCIFIFILGDRKESKKKKSMLLEIKSVYKNATLWILSLFYFITFGAFVAFTVFLPSFLVSYFELTPIDAGIRTAIFIVIATLLRPIGGYLADKFNAFIILLFVFIGITLSGILLSFSPNIGWYTVGALTVAVTAGIGNGTIFKLVPLYFSKQAGIVNGIISAMGGLGGFFPPLLLTTVNNMTGQYAIAFMLMSEFALVSFVIVIFMYYQDKLFISELIIKGTAEGVMVTDTDGKIIDVNPAFEKITGYVKEEVVGKNPSILSSGKHDANFYKMMWKNIKTKGHWQGEIWNKRKDGQIYQELLTISAIRNNTGDIQYYVGIFNDVSNKG